MKNAHGVPIRPRPDEIFRLDEAKYSLRLEVKSHEDQDLVTFFDHVAGDRSLDGIIIVPQFLTDYPFLHTLKTKNFPYVLFRPSRFGSDVIKCLWEAGLRVPQDVSVVGYDNNDICEGIIPSLTTVDHRLEELGQCLAEGLLALIEGDSTCIRKSIEPRMIQRGSHAPRVGSL